MFLKCLTSAFRVLLSINNRHMCVVLLNKKHSTKVIKLSFVFSADDVILFMGYDPTISISELTECVNSLSVSVECSLFTRQISHCSYLCVKILETKNQMLKTTCECECRRRPWMVNGFVENSFLVVQRNS